MRLRRDLGRRDGGGDVGGDGGRFGVWFVTWSAGSGCWAGSFMASRVVQSRKGRECALEGLEGLEGYFFWREGETDG